MQSEIVPVVAKMRGAPELIFVWREDYEATDHGNLPLKIGPFKFWLLHAPEWRPGHRSALVRAERELS
jgi:hypothetical protein